MPKPKTETKSNTKPMKSEPKKKPVAPIKATPPPTQEAAVTSLPPGAKVVYPALLIEEYSTASPNGPVTTEWCKKTMGWETEKEFVKRKLAENPGTVAADWAFGERGAKINDTTFQPIHCRNTADEAIVCWANAGNRAFDGEWSNQLVEMILKGQWAGPFTVPGETVNGETIRISKYGRVLSGQHQMTACIIAGEKLQADRAAKLDEPDFPKYPVWKAHGLPFIETVVIKGLSEDSRVLMTVDYVKPRTVADVFYTQKAFADATPYRRKELCRMLATGVDTLWTRSRAQGYKTHPEVVAFLERHPRLMKCVAHLYDCDSEDAKRPLANMRLRAGQMAAFLFIMASSGDGTDGDTYRNHIPPVEKVLDWSYWDRAEEFFTLLSSGKDFQSLRTALYCLLDSSPLSPTNLGLGGKTTEKLSILAKAWHKWKDWPASAGECFTPDDRRDGGVLCLAYSDTTAPDTSGNTKILPAGEIRLIPEDDFGGIDWPDKPLKGEPEPPPPTGEEYERLKAEALARRQK